MNALDHTQETTVIQYSSLMFMDDQVINLWEIITADNHEILKQNINGI
jgi:hypothetical protein